MISVIVIGVLYLIAAIYVVKQGGKYAKERGNSYKRGMIFPAFIMAIPAIAVISVFIFSR